MIKLLCWYQKQLQRKPLFTKMVTSAALIGLGDGLCQMIEQKLSVEKSKFDVSRNLRLITYGFFMSGPIMHFVYTKILPKIGPGCSLKSVLIKVMFTQTIFTIFGLSLFFFSTSMMSGHTFEHSINQVSKKLWPTYCTSLKIWPLISVLNFAFVPPHFQVFFVNVFSVFWNAYLSYVTFSQNCKCQQQNEKNNDDKIENDSRNQNSRNILDIENKIVAIKSIQPELEGYAMNNHQHIGFSLQQNHQASSPIADQ
ncbi:sym1p [Stylonychia lemnae]|uniref:Sym1p n=1 Tax=Stylonychia lemnae TaxID=5949 RepID=A0A078A122_STYLE|nr:sym1p [Stylonychia lemnae]|eukprot:CDW75552.1 sym1p [Stylonychia lemnae]